MYLDKKQTEELEEKLREQNTQLGEWMYYVQGPPWNLYVKNPNNVTEMDRKVLSLIYPAMNSSSLLSQLYLIKVNHLFTLSYIPNMTLLTYFQYMYHTE